MELVKRYRKKWWAWLIVAGVIGGIINAVDPSPPYKTTYLVEATPAPTAISTQTASPIVDWKTAPVTYENVKTAISNRQWNKSISVINSVNVVGGAVEVHVPLQFDKPVADQLAELGNTIDIFAEILFQNPAVNTVNVFGDSLSFDADGNDSDMLAANILWDRAAAPVAGDIAYLEQTVTNYQRPFLDAKSYTINPLIYKSLPDADKTMLPASR